MFCEKYYKKLLNYAKKDQIWADPNCPYRGSLCTLMYIQCTTLHYTTLHTAVCLELAAGSEIQANLRFNIFSFLPFLAFTGGYPGYTFGYPT